MTDLTATGPWRFPPRSLAPVQSVTGIVQHYAWGDHDFIPQLSGGHQTDGHGPSCGSGTHPNGAAVLADGQPLAD